MTDCINRIKDKNHTIISKDTENTFDKSIPSEYQHYNLGIEV